MFNGTILPHTCRAVAWSRPALVPALLLCSLCVTFAGEPRARPFRAIESQPIPAWVEPLTWELPPGDPPSRVPAEVILVDSQDRLSPEGCDYYYRTVTRLLTAEGVRQNAERQIEFSPDFQRVSIHSLTITRNAEVLDRLPMAQFKELQRERDLEMQMLNGRQTLVTVLTDIRAGDILDVAYTIHDTNPLMRGQVSARHYLGSTYPIRRTRVVIHAPEKLQPKASFFVPEGTQSMPAVLFSQYRLADALQVENSGSERRLLWEATELPPLTFDDAIPAAAYPYFPMLQVASFRTWSEVGEWAEPLFRDDRALPEPIQAMLADWKKLPDASSRLAAAVKWIQEDIRYFSLALGPHNLKPRPLADICTTRFGDCKDKSLLLVRLLREMGVEAWPALVSTYWRGTLRTVSPSPFAFNHAVVAYHWQGRTHWLDPTLKGQRGRQGVWAMPPYQTALVLRPGEGSLTDISQPDTMEPDTTTHERIVIDPASGDGIVTLEVTMRGLQADLYRQQIQTVSTSDLSRHWLNFIGRFYKQVAEIDPPEIRDETERLVVRSRHRIPHFVQKLSGRDVVGLYAYSLRSLIDPPSTRHRLWPYALAHDRYIRHRMEVELPFPAPPEQHPQAIRTNEIEYWVEKGLAGRRFVTEHNLRVRSDSVAAENMGRFADTVDEILAALGTTLTSPLPPPEASMKR